MSVQLIGTLVALGVGLVVWFGVVVPSERRYHERKLKLLQERIERRRREDGPDEDGTAGAGDRSGS
ncbi:MAG: hypothetical protein OEW35_04715 [Gammaproteobacteria bacterium]|nr:hypothetical protein [Gammaproteobacteria bacterium]MDH4254497.1 hypothetical protein [Gammaproteobacteria bacterium]MDH5309101.1 hypothetical protein [Gammaproteobacteria bacterium]